ncbi:MAG: D-aminoacyl-tRNA deacylase [Chitinivibrionales bacterium]
MRIVLQRVKKASVTIDGSMVSRIGPGILILLGVHRDDSAEHADFLAAKCADVRIFNDEEGKMNRSLKDVGGAALVVSQFTLYGDCSKGRRPSFIEAAGPEKGDELYRYFVEQLKKQISIVETGQFGAAMEVTLINDGPVTLVLEKQA